MPSNPVYISIAPFLAEGLGEASPHLMPFRINYTGPANVGTYFHVEPENESASQPVYTDTSLSPQETESVILPQNAEDSNQGTALLSSSLVPAIASVVPDASLTSIGSTLERFITRFRGRIMRGKRVCLPEGYTGLFLQSSTPLLPEDSSRRQPSRKKSKITSIIGRVTRTTRAAKDIGSAIEVEMVQEAKLVQSEGQMHVKILQPISRFSSITVWNPDIHVDEGKDEYIRSLREWTLLASELHTIEMDA